MASGPLSSTVGTASGAYGSEREVEYCERVSAYLGLSLETIISLVKTAPNRSKTQRNPKRSGFETARPTRTKAAASAN